MREDGKLADGDIKTLNRNSSLQASLISRQASWSDIKVVLWNIYSATHCNRLDA
jgi:hypothetical protein